ncbi:MAG TPA: hypothetical protein VGF48_01570 [Thermoanaerobaculia bacterium]|jgi:hypothetical protein
MLVRYTDHDSLPMRLTLSLLAAITAGASIAGAYALTERAHPSRWLVAIGILEPLGLFAGFAAAALLVPRLQFVRRVGNLARRYRDELVAVAVIWSALLIAFVVWELQ